MPNILDDIIASVVENKIPASRQSIATKLSIKQEPVPPGNNNNTSTTPSTVSEDCKADRKKSAPVTAAVIEESTNQYPGIPHCWLNSKQLLWLKDHRNQNNWKLFRECWKQGQVHGCCHSNHTLLTVVSIYKRADNNSYMNGFVFVQPVLVSGIHKRLNASLWKADSFNQEFADHQGDLLNCKDQVVSNSGIKEFWDGFEDITSECILTSSHSSGLINQTAA